MKALLVNREDDNPKMVLGEAPDPKPRGNELLVKVESTALNRADLLQKKGGYPPPEGESEILGLEMSGVVAEAGPDVTKFEPGDRVFGLLGGGGYARYCTIHEDHAIPIPEDLSYEEAAAIPEVFLTAWQALFWLGELKEGETVLIHAGASGVGTAAIQLAKKMVGARVIVTAGSEEKLELCRSLGADLAINYKKDKFDRVIADKSGSESVDLIIDFVGSPYWDMNIRSLAMDGRLVYLSMLGGAKVEEMNLVPLLRKRLTVRGSTLRNRSAEYKSDLVKEFWERCSGAFENGELKPVIHTIMDWELAEEAHQLIKQNLNAGKIVLTGFSDH
ncbi:MAG: NAD(P)H-quinone oxidoreductase [Balneolaceae bacterium]|nr:NAD(P)H-quinone oxidoreductase [Balneolaceae bacterium]MCH8549457.1 NAD(P)H-quinone oxidoreductase [Balneolaceae bacterium]